MPQPVREDLADPGSVPRGTQEHLSGALERPGPAITQVDRARLASVGGQGARHQGPTTIAWPLCDQLGN